MTAVLHSALAVAVLRGDDRMNLTYFVASILTALTPVVILGVIGWFAYRSYRKGRARGKGEGGDAPGDEQPPDDWRYRG